jgi:hypothetical protein
MRPNGTQAKATEASQGIKRVTSISRWLSRKKQPLAQTSPKVSVVLPVYNAEATLAECLTRLYQSGFTEFETIMVDDGSTDSSRAIASNFPVRICVSCRRPAASARPPPGTSAHASPPVRYSSSSTPT